MRVVRLDGETWYGPFTGSWTFRRTPEDCNTLRRAVERLGVADHPELADSLSRRLQKWLTEQATAVRLEELNLYRLSEKTVIPGFLLSTEPNEPELVPATPLFYLWRTHPDLELTTLKLDGWPVVRVESEGRCLGVVASVKPKLLEVAA